MDVTITTRRIEWTKGMFMINWSLIIKGQEFLLGQDAKWVMRVLCMNLNEFFEFIETDDRTVEGRKKIGEFIYHHLELTPRIVKKLQPWTLAQ